MSSQIIKQNADGSPWSAVRNVKGRRTLVAAIRSQDGSGWIEVPAANVVRMVRNTKATPLTNAKAERDAKLAASLLEITQRYRTGGAR